MQAEKGFALKQQTEGKKKEKAKKGGREKERKTRTGEGYQEI